MNERQEIYDFPLVSSGAWKQHSSRRRQKTDEAHRAIAKRLTDAEGEPVSLEELGRVSNVRNNAGRTVRNLKLRMLEEGIGLTIKEEKVGASIFFRLERRRAV